VSAPFALVTVGGGPAGLAAARGFRDADGHGAVAIISDESRMPYRRPPLTKELLRGEIDEAELALEDEHWASEARVSLISGRAVAIDAGARTVRLSGGRVLEYVTCVLSTGAEPNRLPVPGSDDPAVRVVRTLDDVRELLVRLGDGDAVVVIGSGFIGCEIAASLRRRGHPVTLMSDEPAPNAGRLGEDAAARIAGWLQDDGVVLRLGVEVDAIERDGNCLHVAAGSERSAAPVVVMAAGVAPRGELAAMAGAEVNDGAVVVDSAMRTTLPGLLAAGDVALAHNDAAGRSLRVEHWGDALGQGAIAGETAAGRAATWDDVPGFWSTIGDHTLEHAAWGDGYDVSVFESGEGGAFTAWYGRDGRVVGVLAHEADESYERGRSLIAERASWR
jgi:3-phenylpropionate/trans-cinnamate dioxygenase ferredoxin reductase component